MIKIGLEIKITNLGVGPILIPLYLGNSENHTKFVRTLYRKFYKEHKEKTIFHANGLLAKIVNYVHSYVQQCTMYKILTKLYIVIVVLHCHWVIETIVFLILLKQYYI